MIYYQQDPIFKFLNNPIISLYVPNGPKNLAVNQRTGKKLEVFWVDGFDYQTFFSQDYSKKLLLTNNLLILPPEQARHVHQTNKTFYGVFYNDYKEDHVEPVKDFNCFINRYDINRQSWFYQLIRQGLFDRGYISFNSEVNPGRTPGPEFETLSPAQAFDLGFEKYNNIFAAEHELIKGQIPYKNFEDTGELTSVVLATKFSIVLETFFHNNNVITFSEKTFRCLQLPRPWLLFSSQHAVKYLQDLGLDVLGDVVDHSYDKIADPIERQMAILEQAKILVDQPLNQQRCIVAAEHNKALLKSWWAVWKVNIDNDFAIAEAKLQAL
jgi:hypothetical protein